MAFAIAFQENKPKQRSTLSQLLFCSDEYVWHAYLDSLTEKRRYSFISKRFCG